MQVYDKVPLKQCWDRAGRASIKVRWVDVDKNKGQGKAKFRSRLVACLYSNGPDDSACAATPPIESLKPVTSHCALGSRNTGILVCDVSRASFYAAVDEEIYVELCQEDREGQQYYGMCGRLRMAMHGTRSAARSWQKEFGRHSRRPASSRVNQTHACPGTRT